MNLVTLSLVLRATSWFVHFDIALDSFDLTSSAFWRWPVIVESSESSSQSKSTSVMFICSIFSDKIRNDLYSIISSYQPSKPLKTISSSTSMQLARSLPRGFVPVSKSSSTILVGIQAQEPSSWFLGSREFEQDLAICALDFALFSWVPHTSEYPRLQGFSSTDPENKSWKTYQITFLPLFHQ